MKRTKHNGARLAILLMAGLLSASCEDRIDIDLNTAAPRLVIEADLDDVQLYPPEDPAKDEGFPPGWGEWDEDNKGGDSPPKPSVKQYIYISRTVAFSNRQQKELVADAAVEVEELETGKKFPFVYEEPEDGNNWGFDAYTYHPPYVSEAFTPVPGRTYTLRVRVDGQLYEATERMSAYIDLDTIKVEYMDVFDDSRYFAMFEFRDPPGEANYYRYVPYQPPGHSVGSRNTTIDQRVYQDKFTDGLETVHRFEINTFSYGAGNDYGKTRVTSQVKRQIVSPSVFKYWLEVRAIRPNAAAPANPQSNISNGAMGYFSVSSARAYTIDLTSVYQP